MIYENFTFSKTGEKIPVFSSGKLFNSKYNPQKEAEQLAENTKESDFFLVTGIGAGIQIKALQKKFPNSFILAVEASDEDLNFLLETLPELKEIKNEKTTFCSIGNLEQTLTKTYIPTLYSSFSVFSVKSWLLEIDEKALSIKINNALSEISKDFSVQAHFAKIWQKNILENLRFADKNIDLELPAEKECIIIAAGPTLDSKINFLRKNRENLFVFATDTAFLSLEKQGIVPDAVISIDGQMISYKHFVKKPDEKTLFIFDLMANPSAVRQIKKYTDNIIFSVTNHPFEQFCAETAPESFIKADASSGTVTIAALDFALKAGFSKIKIFGADFGYLNGKPYAKGTYLDNINYSAQKKTFSAEKLFLNLMFRSPLKKLSETKKTTDILEFYEKNLYSWSEKNNCGIKKENDYYILQKKQEGAKKICLKKFNIQNFSEIIKEKSKEQNFFVVLLPLIAYFKNQDLKNGKTRSFYEYSKLALNFILRYNF